jgi:CxxC motif-containing protein (DUF1111 family)
VFGLGLVEAITDGALRKNLAESPSQKEGLGISGRLNTNGNDGTVTRFGWKAQNKSLHIFAGEAYNVESGITNHLFPQERAEGVDCMYNDTPEDSLGFEDGAADDLILFSAFMRFSAPPERGATTEAVSAGEQIFMRVGCQHCHTPTLQTPHHAIAALSEKDVPLYSDLALHNMARFSPMTSTRTWPRATSFARLRCGDSGSASSSFTMAVRATWATRFVCIPHRATTNTGLRRRTP